MTYRVRQILAALDFLGPSTYNEVAEYIGGDDARLLSSVMSRMNRASPKRPKRIYVVRFERDDRTGKRTYPRAVYALGDKPDALPVGCDRPAAQRRYREKRVGRYKMNSVFHLGLTERQCGARGA